MKNAVILHGTMGSPKENWYQWLGNELKDKGFVVWIPTLPGADKPNPCNYNPHLLDYWRYDDETVMIGHSSGAVAILNLLNNTPSDFKIKKAVMVAGFKDDLDWDPTRELFIYPWDFKKIRKKAEEFILIHSDNDPYVNLEHAKYLKKHLGKKAKLIIKKGQGHFSVNSGGKKYKKFPELLKYI